MSREETETIMVWNSADEFAVVDTMHPWMKRACEEAIRRTGRGRERNPNHGVRDGRKIRWEFEVPVEAIRAPMPPARRTMTEQQRELARKRLESARLRRNRRQADRAGDRDVVATAESQGKPPEPVETM